MSLTPEHGRKPIISLPDHLKDLELLEMGSFVMLKPSQVEVIKGSLSAQMGLSAGADLVDIYRKVQSVEAPIPLGTFGLLHEGATVTQLLDAMKIPHRGEFILASWVEDGEILKISGPKINDVVEGGRRGGFDDMLLFDESRTWFVDLNHAGGFGIVTCPNQKFPDERQQITASFDGTNLSLIHP